MHRESDDEAWRLIVSHYGDRAELDDRDTETADDDPDIGPPLDAARIADDDEDGFVPPVPPPLPVVAPQRMVAWAGLFGAPAVLLASLVVGLSLPPVVGYLLVAAFVGGFGYLVLTMPRGPADPFDDGARL